MAEAEIAALFNVNAARYLDPVTPGWVEQEHPTACPVPLCGPELIRTADLYSVNVAL
jgi:hypothetical protein